MSDETVCVRCGWPKSQHLEVIGAGLICRGSVFTYSTACPNCTRELAAREAAEKERDEARFRPMGDNHHNAAQCPYCGDPLRAAQAALAAERVANAGLRAAVEDARQFIASERHRRQLYEVEKNVIARLDAALSAAPPLPMGALRAASVEVFRHYPLPWSIRSDYEKIGPGLHGPETRTQFYGTPQVRDACNINIMTFKHSERGDRLFAEWVVRTANASGSATPLTKCCQRGIDEQGNCAGCGSAAPASVPPAAAGFVADTQARVTAARKELIAKMDTPPAAAPQEQQGAAARTWPAPYAGPWCEKHGDLCMGEPGHFGPCLDSNARVLAPAPIVRRADAAPEHLSEKENGK